MDTFKLVGRHLFGLIFLWTVLYFVANFSVAQSVVLTLLAHYVVVRLWQVDGRLPEFRFIPYFVEVIPDWYAILKDWELVADDHEYSKLYEALDAISSSKDSILRRSNSVRFTVLDDETIGQRTLVYSNYDIRVFVSNVDFEWSLAPLTMRRRVELPTNEPFTPRFFVHGGLGSYSFGIVVAEHWWENKKANFGGAVAAREMFEFGTVEVTIATIPRSEFRSYWERLTPHPKADTIWRKQRDEDRLKFGWVVEEKPSRNWPEMLQHKYFKVRHDRI